MRWWLVFVSGLIVVIAVACASSEPESIADLSSGSDLVDPPGITIKNFVCQLDPPTYSATAIGGIRNALSTELVDITPVVTWLDADKTVIASKTGSAIAAIPAGDTALFSIPVLLTDGMTMCRIELIGADMYPVSGELQAEAILTSELAK